MSVVTEGTWMFLVVTSRDGVPSEWVRGDAWRDQDPHSHSAAEGPDA